MPNDEQFAYSAFMYGEHEHDHLMHIAETLFSSLSSHLPPINRC